jgi:tRNA 2-thiouridine synthesizing protein A
MFEEIDVEDQIAIAGVLRDLKSICARRCTDCDDSICGHEALMSLVMGFKDAPRCWPCLAGILEQNVEQLRDHLYTVIGRRSCYFEGWLWANHEEGFGPETLPQCMWPTRFRERGGQEHLSHSALQNKTPMSDTNETCDAVWDAGDMGCGDLVLELRTRLQSVKPGQILKILATNPGAEEDLPAWCRMTGNDLVASHHPVYLIKRKVT